MTATRHPLYFWLLICLAIVILWFMPFYPSSDGMSHVYMGKLIKSLLLHDEAYTGYYAITAAPIPNSACQMILAVLSIFFPPLLAEKLFVIGLSVIYMVALRRFFALVSNNHAFSYYAPFLFMFTAAIIVGNFNHILAISLAFLLYELWVRWTQQQNTWQALGLVAGGAALYFSHLYGMALWAMMVGSHIIFENWQSYRRQASLRPLWRQSLMLGLCLVVPMICLYHYMQLPKLGLDGIVPPTSNVMEELFYGRPFLGYVHSEAWLSKSIVLLGLFAYGWAIYKMDIRTLAPLQWVVLTLSLFFLILLIAGPDYLFGGWVLKPRYAHCFWMFALAFICSRLGAVRLPWIIPLAPAAMVLCIIVRGLGMFNVQPLLDEIYEAVPLTKPHSFLLTVNVNPERTEYPEVAMPALATYSHITNFGAYFATLNNLIWLDDYQMRERNVFPVSVLPNIDPLEHLTPTFNRTLGQADSYKDMDLRLYAKSTGKPINYVAVWGKENYIPNDEVKAGYNHIMKQLKKDYRLAYTSSHGLLQLWELKEKP